MKRAWRTAPSREACVVDCTEPGSPAFWTTARGAAKGQSGGGSGSGVGGGSERDNCKVTREVEGRLANRGSMVDACWSPGAVVRCELKPCTNNAVVRIKLGLQIARRTTKLGATVAYTPAMRPNRPNRESRLQAEPRGVSGPIPHHRKQSNRPISRLRSGPCPSPFRCPSRVHSGANSSRSCSTDCASWPMSARSASPCLILARRRRCLSLFRSAPINRRISRLS